MAQQVHDRWLWLGFGLFFVVAAKGLHYAIRETIELTKVDPSYYETEPKRQGEQPEDTISLEDLRILAESPNSNISNSAISIIASRFDKLPNASDLLRRDLDCDNEELRERAKTTVQFLKSRGTRLTTLPRSPPGLPDSPPDSPTPDMMLSNAELAHRLGGAIGGVNGGNAWVGGFVPSADDPVAGWTDVPRERPVGLNEEELERRRRRREAMVLHEGAGALREDDIIRPRT